MPLPPVIIIAFNRIRYIDIFLQSLRQQVGEGILEREIHFFQDGSINAYSGIQYAEKADLEACAQLFSNYFPNGVIHSLESNIGIMENFRRAEEFVFEELRADVAYFFEDDMVLSPHYLFGMDMLWDHVKDNPLIGYFSVYGDHHASYSKQKDKIRELIGLEHHWAFGLTARHWRKLTKQLAPYYKIVGGRDYRHRNGSAVWDWFRSTGYSHAANSQDAAKALLTNLMGVWRLRTVACWGVYIGEVGTNTNPEFYSKHNFLNTKLMNTAPESFIVPDADDIISSIMKERERYILDYDQQVLARKSNPAKPDDVEAAYRIILERNPESRDVLELWARGRTVREVRCCFLESKEYKKRNKRGSSEMSILTDSDISDAYRILLEREAESGAAIEFWKKIGSIHDVRTRMLESAEYKSKNVGDFSRVARNSKLVVLGDAV